MMTGNSRSETKGEFKVRSVLRIESGKEPETLSIPSQEIYKMNWYDGIVYAFPLGILYLLTTRMYQHKNCNMNSACCLSLLLFVCLFL